MIKKLTYSFLTFLVIGIFSFVLFEVTCELMLSFPRVGRWLPSPLLAQLKEYYKHHDRNIIQFDPNMSQYDSELTYLFKPGQYSFSNREFENDYFINSQGLRDDEDSLIQPQIIVLGDSLTLGWGVNQNETFSELLQTLSQKKVLNTGVSSYGTAREIALLKRLDQSGLETLVIQYSENDIGENRALVRRGKLPIAPKEMYSDYVRKHQESISYHYGKYMMKLAVPMFLNVVSTEKNRQKTKVNRGKRKKPPNYFVYHIELFLKIVRKNEDNINPRAKFVVFSVEDSEAFAKEFEKQIKKAPDRNRFTVVSFPEMSRTDFYTIDDHLRKSGHEKIAVRLNQIVL